MYVCVLPVSRSTLGTRPTGNNGHAALLLLLQVIIVRCVVIAGLVVFVGVVVVINRMCHCVHINRI